MFYYAKEVYKKNKDRKGNARCRSSRNHAAWDIATAMAADNTTTPRVIAAADGSVIVTSDATQLYLTGSITMVHDSYGSPNPQLVNNGDGSWVLIMYKSQTIALGVNNPYAAYTEYVPQIVDTVDGPSDADVESGLAEPYFSPASSENEGSIQAAMYGSGYDYGYADIYNNVVVTGDRVGSSVYNLNEGYYYGEEGANIHSVPYSISNTVTLAIYVLDAQEGAQDPLRPVDEQSRIDNHNRLAGTTRGTIVYFGIFPSHCFLLCCCRSCYRLSFSGPRSKFFLL